MPEKVNYTHIGDRIVSCLRKFNLKQTEACQKSGISQTAMSQYCTDKRIPDTVALHKLAVLFETSMDWILTGQENAYTQNNNENKLTLSSLELDLITMFRVLPELAQKEIFDFSYFKYKQLSSEKKDSIFWTYTDEKKEETTTLSQTNSNNRTA